MSEAARRAIEALKPILGDRLVTSEAVREHHSRDMSSNVPHMPDAVAFPKTEVEVQAIVRVCAEHRVPIVPYGAGSSMEGHTIPVHGGISVSTREMNNIVEIVAEDALAVVQPGVTRKQLNTELRALGLTFPVDPGADASLGGMASTRASGTAAVRYGTMRENVLALRVVTADGEVLKTGSRAKKSSTGYDLTRLFVGSEGTLGIITELTVRLHPVPEQVAAAVCAFDTVEGAIATVQETVQYGIPIGRVEFLDEYSIESTNMYSGMNLKVAPTLFFEFEGTPAWVEEQSQIVAEIAANNGGSGFQWSTDADERARLWQARHNHYWAVKSRRAGCEIYTSDICVPISKLAENIVAGLADIEASFLEGQIIAHAGDGNFHAGYLVDPNNEVELAEAARLADRSAERALASGGTVSGEHGIGIGKLKFMRREHGDAAVESMKRIKAALDPLGIMNPGKMGQAG
ncbi:MULTISPECIES: FAD-linked oxidase C-terminal domain-containing protein [unclassified Aminobacter]|uniref:FAD-binding oxidoreductase n=1 Tax=unclassified Aminobacter TaxID=2644704 RepID=UPI00046487E0|nr:MULTISPECIES: FAD-linked oxidase C-terminal domain-containing protein [unclassified Aminobacter]TWH31473.1 D-lactate dehydrogenase (cytochrome) [Aminobacter sp. J15]